MDNYIPRLMVTKKYDIFTHLDGNRAVADGRKAKIMKSIQKIGYIPSPIIVNEQYAIIDGQGRLSACRELDLPVYYIIVPGLTIDHCISMNINQSNWSIMDYIESYAEQGDNNYQILFALITKHKSIGYRATSALLGGTIQGADTESIKNGMFVALPDRMDHADQMCNWLETNILPLKTKIRGRFEYLLFAIIFAIDHTSVDKERLVKVIRKNAYDIMPPATTLSALREIERIYNYNLSSKKIYFTTEYDKYLTENQRGYRERWSQNARKKQEV